MATDVRVHPVKRSLTFLAPLKVLSSTNPVQPQGSEVTYVEGLQYGASRIQGFLVAASGFPSKTEYDAAIAATGRNPQQELALLGNAAGNSATQQPGNHYPANPFKGRRISGSVSKGTRVPRSGPNAGKPVEYLAIHFAPA
jgi:hypothetical protein